jgi:hypothetical protein
MQGRTGPKSLHGNRFYKGHRENAEKSSHQRQTGIKRPLQHSIQKNPKGPQNFSKRPLFDILYGKLKKPLRSKMHYHYGQYVPASHHFKKNLYSTKNVFEKPCILEKASNIH